MHGVQFLHKRLRLKLADSGTRQEASQFLARITLVSGKIVAQEPQTSERVVPPIVKVHYGNSAVRQNGLDATEEPCLVPRPANQGVEAGQAMDAVPERRLKIIGAHKNDVLQMLCFRFGTGIGQRVHRQVAVKDQPILPRCLKCAISGPRREIAINQLRFTFPAAQKLKSFTSLAGAQSPPPP